MHTPEAAALEHALRRQPDSRVAFWDVLFGLPPELAEALLGRSLASGTDRVGALNDYSPEDQLALAHVLGIGAIGFRAGWGFGKDIWETDAKGVRRYVDGRLKSRADLADLPPLQVESTCHKLGRFLEVAREGGTGVFVGLHGIFHDVMQSVGYSDFLVASLDDPAFIEDLLDLSLERNVRLVEALAGYPAAFFRFYEDVAYNRGLMLRPETFRRLWLPRVTRLTAPARAAGIPITLHCCGRLDEVVPLAIEAGFAAIDPVQPDCNDIYALHERFGARICLMGNIGLDVLTAGPPARIEAVIAEQVKRLGGGGGYVIKTGNHFDENVPPAHVLALARAARRAGGLG